MVKLELLVLFCIFSLSKVRADTTCNGGVCKRLGDCRIVYDAYMRHHEDPTFCIRSEKTVCCPEDVVTTPRPILNRISAQKCREYSTYANDEVLINVPGKDPITKIVSVCGHTAVQLIIGGESTGEREFPHQALIGYALSKTDDDFLCGGSLISDQFVLSAAHCLYSREFQEAKFVKLGDVVRGKMTENSYTYEIIERIKHPQYKHNSVDHDIALFKLDQILNLKSYHGFVRPICLPYYDENPSKVIATGFGFEENRDDSGAQHKSEGLLKVTLNIFNSSVCNSIYDVVDKVKHVDDETKLCVGSTKAGKDTCGGDSGGPIQIYNIDNSTCMYTIVGVTSFGLQECGTDGVPGIYTKVYHYLDWIENIVWK